MINLPKVTLLTVTTIDLDKHIKALEYSCKGINFGAVKLITHEKPENLPDNITFEQCDKLSNIDDWNHYIFFNLTKHVNTDFCLLIHDDGFVVHPEQWRDEFLNYDYIGAPWGIPNCNITFRDINNNLIRVGNSVSLRSKKLIDLPSKLNIQWKKYQNNYNEDTQITVHNRHIFIEHGCVFADINIAKYFSHETMIPEIEGIKPFAFHNYGEPNHINFNYPKF